MHDEIIRLGLCDLSAALARKELSAVEATKACLAAIESEQPRLNCFLSIEADAALDAAAEADKEIAAGTRRGPLHGVPLAQI
jgi:aspartyl-tRNA(Asn)/glutamyl-tRNA(Gln) amidotransferase subunit A